MFHFKVVPNTSFSIDALLLFQISSFVSLTDRQEVLHGVFLLVAVPKHSILVGVVSVKAVPGNQAET